MSPSSSVCTSSPSHSLLAALLLPADEDELVGLPVAAPSAQPEVALAERSLGARVTDGRPALASAVRVVAGVLSLSTDMRPPAHFPLLARLAELDELRLRAPHLTDRAPAVLEQEAHLAAGELDGDVLRVSGEDDSG